MADRVRSMMRSASKRGSVSHMGTTPCKYMVEFIVSHVDQMKSADEVCFVWDRRGKTVHTQVAKVSSGKATFRETLAMETTLFRRVTPGSKIGDEPKPGEDMKFDEKKAKFILRRGGPTGKALGKITLNLADYIQGLSGTVFADLKMSNSAVVSVKIVSKFLHIGKATKKGDDDASAAGGSDNESMIGDDGMDNDSVFGDDVDSNMSMEIEVEREVSSIGGTNHRVPVKKIMSQKTPEKGDSKPKKANSVAMAAFSPVSSDGKSPKMEKTGSMSARISRRGSGASSLKESKSIRRGLRRKEKDSEELRKALDAMKEENSKLRAANKAQTVEIEAMREELNAPQGEGDGTSDSGLKEEVKSLRRKVKELKAHNKALEADLEEAHAEAGDGPGGASGGIVKELRENIEELELALRREPKFMDVVNELKVMKVSFALANMEKEQAQFALNQYKANLNVA